MSFEDLEIRIARIPDRSTLGDLRLISNPRSEI